MSPESESPSSPSSPPVPGEEFVQQFTLNQRGLYLFILAQVGNVHGAEEVLQETNLVVWAKMHQFVPGTSFLSWARQIARFEILKYRQRFRRDKLTFSDEFVAAVAEEVDAQSETQERRRDALQFCLEKLQPADRELIQQRYQPGLSGKDLAENLGRPANSVYQSLGRIRKALLDCIHRQLTTGLEN